MIRSTIVARPWKTIVAGLAVVLTVAAGAGAVVFWPEAEEPAAADLPPRRPLTPFEAALGVLQAQAAALEKGDEKGWLAPVDTAQPKLIAKYRTIFRNLRGLDVGHVEYHADPQEDSTVVLASLGYCFKGAVCPEWRSGDGHGPPKLEQEVTFALRDGRYVLTGMTPAKRDRNLKSPPWESQTLHFARGARVVVAGPSSQRKHLKRILKVAEKAAAVTDRFAGQIGNRQGARYRIYLADEKSWKSWYGGNDMKWAIGYAIPLNAAGSDIVLRTRKVLQEKDLSVIVQHELAHVVTLGGLSTRDTDDDQWLVEGIAEYIGSYPKKPQNTYSQFVLEAAFSRHGSPRTIAAPPLTSDADDLTVAALYAMGHYASGCIASKYGEPKLMKFADLVLRKGSKPDAASRAVFGKPFPAVDKACLSWIKSRV
ncbi:hypothetical protein AB0F81_02420 [Actinoplanes sp. NPDC024001]|uniref:hypothetical protein n=1 Tax=Actinoplanes sp. NPDC024001 TaxID=3154598 RepID=UPI0033F33FD3